MAASRSKRNLKRSSSPLNISGTSSKKKKVIPAIEEYEYASNSPSSFTTLENSIYNQYGQFVFKDVNFETLKVNHSRYCAFAELFTTLHLFVDVHCSRGILASIQPKSAYGKTLNRLLHLNERYLGSKMIQHFGRRNRLHNTVSVMAVGTVPSLSLLDNSIEAPPSFKPAKKYSDITGLPAKYKDPQTRMLYSTSEEFLTIRKLPMDIIGGYLTLRKASPT